MQRLGNLTEWLPAFKKYGQGKIQTVACIVGELGNYSLPYFFHFFNKHN